MLNQGDDYFGFGRILEWRPILHLCGVLTKIFGDSVSADVFFRLGMAEGFRILKYLPKMNNEFLKDLDRSIEVLASFLKTHGYVNKLWFIELKNSENKLLGYCVRVENNHPLISFLNSNNNSQNNLMKNGSIYCYFFKGVLKVVFEYLLGSTVHVAEIECQFQNNHYCEYRVLKV